MSPRVLASTMATLPSEAAIQSARASTPASSSPASDSLGRLDSTGIRGSSPCSVCATGAPSTNTTPPMHTRPSRGCEGINTTRRPHSTNAASSAAQLPRSVESILCTWRTPGSNARARRRASSGGTCRDRRSITTQSAPDEAAENGTTSTIHPASAHAAPASVAPVLSSAVTTSAACCSLIRAGEPDRRSPLRCRATPTSTVGSAP